VDWVHEVKFDGWRIQIRVEDGSAKLLTRNGFDWTKKFPELAKQARGLDNCIIDGELCALDAGGLPDFSALQASMEANTTDDLIYFAFDAMFAEDRDIRRLSLFERKAKLRKLLDDAGGPPSIRYVSHLEVDGKDVIKAACEMKLEGIISKRASAPYVSGRKGNWTKSKCRAGQHAVVGGYVTGPEGFRSLLLGIPNGKRLVPIGRVGTGFPQKLLTWLQPKLRQLETEKSPFSAVIPRKPQRKLHYLKPELVAEVEFSSWTGDGVLRQASLKSLHEAKDRKLRPDWINLPEALLSEGSKQA
jgi:bifunctional non-homologous end joining protein LigD